jgi:hypothetical protein
MPIDVHPKRRQPNTEQIVEEQKRQARLLREQQQAAKSVPATVTTAPAPLTMDTRTPEQRYIDTIAPSAIAGELIKFSKEGKFVLAESGEEVSGEISFTALCDEVLVGWIKFAGEGEPPLRHQGLLYNGFVMPKRESLGDQDPRTWPEGLSGQPTDPWQHQICLVVQNPETQALYTFATSSLTGRRAVGNLLRHYDRMRRASSDFYPVVKLKPGGFQHKDPRVGFVATPTFQVVGRTLKNSAAVPDTSPGADMSDSLPI